MEVREKRWHVKYCISMYECDMYRTKIERRIMTETSRVESSRVDLGFVGK